MALPKEAKLAEGRYVTGFSKPYVAKYSATGGTISYTGGMRLARGASVSLTVNASDEVKAYLDNELAETAPKKFKDGTASVTVDGLHAAARKMITGEGSPDTDGWTAVGDDAVAPYVGVGYITRYMSAGVEIFVPTLLPKTKVQPIPENANTQEESIAFQTTALTFDLFRADDANHNWKFIGDDFATEAEAETALKKKLGIA